MWLFAVALLVGLLAFLPATQAQTSGPRRSEQDSRSEPRPSDRRNPTDNTPTQPDRSIRAEQPATRTNPFAFAFGRRTGRRQRLVRVPDMFGDFFLGGGITGDTGPDFISAADLPLRGGSRLAKAAEHNKAFPEDRLYLTYNHFHNALEVETVAVIPSQSSHVDRYTLAFERTISECTSIELRMPFISGFEYTDAGSTLAGGEVGDLGVLLQTAIYECDCTAFSSGLGVTAPTGSNARGSFPLLMTTYEVENQAVHLAPFVALSHVDQRDFFHVFTQIDVALNGNRIVVDDAVLATTGVGRINEPTLLYLDLAAGLCSHFARSCR